MADLELRIGPPTGHQGQHVVTLTAPGSWMIRGAMHPIRATELAELLGKGCRATGRTFEFTRFKPKRGPIE